MNMRHLALALALVSFLFPSPASSSPDRDPFAGPLEVLTHVSGVAHPGGAKSMDLAIENRWPVSMDVIVTHALVRWADGSVTRLDLDAHRIQLEPRSAVVMFAFVAIPPDVALGEATFEVRAHVARLSDDAGGIGHSDIAGDSHAVDRSTFVVAP